MDPVRQELGKKEPGIGGGADKTKEPPHYEGNMDNKYKDLEDLKRRVDKNQDPLDESKYSQTRDSHQRTEESETFTEKVKHQAQNIGHTITENVQAGYEKVKETLKDATGIGKDEDKNKR